MRKNYSKRHDRGTERYDRVYVNWPRLANVRGITARPTKTIYLNTCAAPWATYRWIDSPEELEIFCRTQHVSIAGGPK